MSATVGALVLLPYVSQTDMVPIMILFIGIILLIFNYTIIKPIKSFLGGGSNESPDTNEKEIAAINMYIKDYNELKKKMKKLKRKSGDKEKILQLKKDMAEAKEVINYYKSKLNT